MNTNPKPIPNAARVRPNPKRKVASDEPYGVVGNAVTHGASAQPGVIGWETRERDIENLKRVQSQRPLRPPGRRP